MRKFRVFVILILASVASVFPQTAPPPTVLPATNPIALQVNQFHSDIHAMRASGSIDTTKIITDLQAIVTAAQASVPNLPAKIQTQVQDVRVAITSGTSNPQQILMMAAGVMLEIVSEINVARLG